MNFRIKIVHAINNSSFVRLLRSVMKCYHIMVQSFSDCHMNGVKASDPLVQASLVLHPPLV